MPVIGPVSVEAPKQHTQPSRKGKKAWRKNVDLSEVESGLVQLNEEVIRGGVIREKPSSDLFTIDVQGSGTSAKPPRSKTLRADAIINQRSAVPAVSLRKRAGDKTDGVVGAKRLRSDWVSHKELARLKRVADGHHETVTLDASYDVWADGETCSSSSSSNNNNTNNNFVQETSAPKLPKSMRQKPVSLLASGKQAPAVPRPTGAHSYNPLFTDYEGRLAAESAKALDAERRRVEAEAAEAALKVAAARSGAEADAAEERANMSEWEEDSEWEGFQSEAENGGVAKKQPKRKTQAQRNRIARRKEDERAAANKAATKARRAQELRIAEIAQEVAEREAVVVLDGEDAGDAEDGEDGEDGEGEGEEKLRRRQLGRFRLPEKDLELVLPDELQESLRLLRPEGNLLRERYRSLLVRGRVESRRHLPFRRQARTKVTEKWTHKDFVI